MKVLTIGFKGRSAENFFHTLRDAAVQKVIDVRRRNNTQMAGYTKGRDLKFFLEHCFGIAYEYVPDFAPSEERLKTWLKGKKDAAAWSDYVRTFTDEVLSRNTIRQFQASTKGLDRVCLLCSEETAERCHRGLLAEYFEKECSKVEVEHL